MPVVVSCNSSRGRINVLHTSALEETVHVVPVSNLARRQTDLHRRWVLQRQPHGLVVRISGTNEAFMSAFHMRHLGEFAWNPHPTEVTNP